jgi:hypothetical protein
MKVKENTDEELQRLKELSWHLIRKLVTDNISGPHRIEDVAANICFGDHDGLTLAVIASDCGLEDAYFEFLIEPEATRRLIKELERNLAIYEKRADLHVV